MSVPICPCGGEVIGVERQGWYDGVAYWECAGCQTSYRRAQGDPWFDRLWARRQDELEARRAAS